MDQEHWDNRLTSLVEEIWEKRETAKIWCIEWVKEHLAVLAQCHGLEIWPDDTQYFIVVKGALPGKKGKSYILGHTWYKRSKEQSTTRHIADWGTATYMTFKENIEEVYQAIEHHLLQKIAEYDEVIADLREEE